MQALETDARPAYLAPNEYVDSEHPAVVAFAREHAAGAAGDRDRAVQLYYAVRDGIRYDPYKAGVTPEALCASATLAAGRSWCVGKAVLLAACCRSLGIGARLGYADVRNHLSTENMRRHMQTDVFYYHGYTQLLVDGKWVKATPAFNVELCEKTGLRTLEFDGTQDSLYHPFDREGQRHMEYLRDHGVYDDVPTADILACWKKNYPNALGVAPDATGEQESTDGDFDGEVEQEFGGG
jgi:transglutaminase-like putative cysteine protease